MCSPAVMAAVRKELSRRRAAGLLGAAVVAGVSAAAPMATRARQATPVATPTAMTEGPVGIVLGPVSMMQDLTYVFGEDFPIWPGNAPTKIENVATVANDGFYANVVSWNEHTGTHMDAPAHFADGGLTADELPIEQLLAPLAIVDISERAATDPDAQLMPDDVLAWEAQYGALPPGAFVAMYSGWGARVHDPEAFLNLDDDDVMHFPGIHPDTAKFLVEERDISGVGVDTLSQDYGASQDFATHITILGAGKFGVENLANLETVPPYGAAILVGGPTHKGASGGPSRVFALFN